MTRDREQLVLLIEGDDISFLYDLTRPEKSETARRNTGLFEIVVRESADIIPYADHLITEQKRGIWLEVNQNSFCKYALLNAYSLMNTNESLKENGRREDCDQIFLLLILPAILLFGSIWECLHRKTIGVHGNEKRTGTRRTPIRSVKHLRD